MEIDNRKILGTIVLFNLLLFALIAFTSSPMRIILGLLFVLFFPGYTLLSTLFPNRDDLGRTERVAFSFALSIAVVPLTGLILNYTPWGITLYTVLISVTLFIFITSGLAWNRQRKLPPSDRLSVTVRINLRRWSTMPWLDKALSITLAVAIMTAIGCLGFVITTPKHGEKFTEFYILNIEGKAEDYPQRVKLGEPVDIVIGVVNHEYQSVSYQVGVTIDRIENSTIDIGTLANEEKRETRVSLIPEVVGEKRKVEFNLYKNGEDEPYFNDPLYLYIDVYQ